MQDLTIRNLKYLLKTYDGIKRETARTKQRLKSLIPDADEKNQPEIQEYESRKGKISRQIEKALEYWPIWTEWMKDIKGIGPFIAGNLVILYYYRFVPLCKKCGGDLEDFTCIDCDEKAKGDGLLEYRIEDKDFRQVSSWWHYLGEHNDPETGRMPRRKKGVQGDWSSLGRNISWQIGESINKFGVNGHKYKAFYNTHKEKGKRHGDAIRRTRKLFLSHFWHVARTIDGKPNKGPYVVNLPGHNVIPPYYWSEPRNR